MTQSPSGWTHASTSIVASCIEFHRPMGPMKWQSLEADHLGEFLVYPTPVELVGGEEDGAIVMAGFSLDLHELLAAFDEVSALHWYAHGLGPDDRNGPPISLEGIDQGPEVWLRVLAEPPEDEEPGLRLDASAAS